MMNMWAGAEGEQKLNKSHEWCWLGLELLAAKVDEAEVNRID